MIINEMCFCICIKKWWYWNRLNASYEVKNVFDFRNHYIMLLTFKCSSYSLLSAISVVFQGNVFTNIFGCYQKLKRIIMFYKTSNCMVLGMLQNERKKVTYFKLHIQFFTLGLMSIASSYTVQHFKLRN